MVATRSSVMGRSRALTPNARAISEVISTRAAPSARRLVRWRWVPRSRSPRRNQAGPPRRSRASMACQVSPAKPQPVSGFTASAKV